MLKKGSIKFMVIVLLLGVGLSLLPLPVQAGCFRNFERCMNKVRTSFWGGFIDTLDCELGLASCITRAFRNGNDEATR